MSWPKGLIGVSLLTLPLAAWSSPALSEEALFPPGYSTDNVIDIRTASPAEMAAWAHWYLDRQHEPPVTGRRHLPLVPQIIFELAYSGVTPGNENAALAIELAERTSIRDFDYKEVILADLKYGVDGIEPDPTQYDHSLYKTALYLLNFPPGPFFPELDYQNLDLTDDAIAELFVDEIPFEASELPPGFPRKLGYQNALDIAKEAIIRIAGIDRRSTMSPTCEQFAEALSYMDGTSIVGMDQETAQLLFLMFNDVYSVENSHPDVNFYLYENYHQLRILNGRFERADFLYSAMMNGHPTASLILSAEEIKLDTEITIPRFNQLALQLKVAQFGGRDGAGQLLQELEENTRRVTYHSTIALAEETAQRYRDARCRSLIHATDP